MVLDVNNATLAIKKAGATNVRATPMSGQSITEGDYQIEINENGQWIPVIAGIKKLIAEQIITQALNRVILG